MTGVRTSKTVGSVTHNYIYASGKLIRETYGSTTLDFLYDQNGNPFAMNYTVGNTTTTYYYILNLQGDVVRIVNASGVTVGTYSYDAWGKVTVNYGSVSNATTITDANPLRYRGYVYDTETGFYYLQSRYYDPQIGRFINADTQFDGNGGFSGYNLFTYCANSPITLKDTSGFAIETALDIVSIVGSLCSFVANPTWASAGYVAWDIVAAIIPCVPGSYISKGTKFIVKVAGKLDDFADGSKLLTGSYKALKKMFKGIKGLEIHHLIEKRFRSLFKVGANDFLSLPLTKEMHQIITNRWRNLHKLDDIFQDFAYGSNYRAITYDLMVKAVKEVYSDMPAILDAVLDWLKKNWKG